ncbi:C4-dicarboxylate transporter DcuC [Budvicia diplopodorum]|uniref:C4-dicarboxylate transporter DcuC n=1 Tax=Budvicia diplopodorum TaxID=1119056 RepID=UPI00135CDAF9|nr:C4-dicarboxylate transporter DcuC [Budvicia diplopodorum]
MTESTDMKNIKKSWFIWIISIPIILASMYFCFGQKAFVLAVSFIVIILIGMGIMRRIYAQALVLVGGCVLLLIAAFLFPDAAITGTSSGSKVIDVFVEIKNVFSKNIASLGLIIMVIAGFSRYMNDIGASGKLVEICVKPLGRLKSRYMLLGGCYIIMQLLALFISSPSGLALLMMSTLYPILRSIGCSKASVAAVIASGVCIDYGPSATGSILISEITGYDLFSFFVEKQIPVVWILFIFIGVMHMFVQAYWDKKEPVPSQDDSLLMYQQASAEKVPYLFALLPIIPMILLFIFSSLAEEWLPKALRFKMDVITAMFISFFIAFFCDLIRTFNIKKAADKIAGLFDQMGQSFIMIVSILLCAQVLAQGMIKIGFIETLFSFIPSGTHTHILVVLSFSILVFFSSVVLGTGSTFNAFAPLAAEMAKGAGISVYRVLIPMHFSGSLGRSFSPIAGVTIAVAGLVGLTPFDIIKRNALQLGSAYILMLILSHFLIV